MSTKPTKPNSNRTVLVAFILSTLAGACLIIFGIFFVLEGNASQSWPTAEGEVVSIWVRRTTSDNGSQTYHYEVTYRYVVDDTVYTSDRYSLGSGSTASRNFNEEEEARAEGRERYPTGSLVIVSYDPVDPSSAVLNPGLNWGTFVPLIMGIFFLIGGVVLLYMANKNSRRAQ